MYIFVKRRVIVGFRLTISFCSVQQQLAEADKHGEGPSSYQNYGTTNNEFAGNTQGFQNAVNARVVENM